MLQDKSTGHDATDQHLPTASPAYRKGLSAKELGATAYNLTLWPALPNASNYRFHALFTYHQLKQRDHFPVAELLSEGITRLQQFPGRVDAVIG